MEPEATLHTQPHDVKACQRGVLEASGCERHRILKQASLAARWGIRLVDSRRPFWPLAPQIVCEPDGVSSEALPDQKQTSREKPPQG